MPENLIPNLEVEIANLLECESKPILKKRVLGKNDVDIAAMIQHLKNSDWIRMGLAFHETNNYETCPFCQQHTTEQFTRNLNDYFDDAYHFDIQTIDRLISDYQMNLSRLQQILEHILNYPSQHIDTVALMHQKQSLDACLMLNMRRLFSKKQEPSQPVELESIGMILSDIRDQIALANIRINEHNQLIFNLSAEKSRLNAQVWAYVVNVELRTELAEYFEKKAALSQTLTHLTQLNNEYESQKNNLLIEIANLEKQTSSVQPTIAAMNKILDSSGFQGFSFAQADSDIAAYKLVRPDGTDAKKTLSEGEKTFISFLYFYHLIKGSNSDTGIIENRVVVFDDPVSSLDSDILFIVSNLIKALFDEVRHGTGCIKQIFIFTHNIYFYTEVTFNTKRPINNTLKEETFWIVRKQDLITRLEKQASNPIKTPYDLLWSEIRDNKYYPSNIQNILRNILEHYFRFLGDIDFQQLCDLFEGREKIICNTLLSPHHDGMYSTYDDAHVVSQDNFTVSIYLYVFKEIFEKSGHIKHYEMMMRTSHSTAPLK